MDELIKELKVFGFSNEYLKAIENQKFDEIMQLEVNEIEYMAYDSPVEYMTDSSLEKFFYKE